MARRALIIIVLFVGAVSVIGLWWGPQFFPSYVVRFSSSCESIVKAQYLHPGDAGVTKLAGERMRKLNRIMKGDLIKLCWENGTPIGLRETAIELMSEAATIEDGPQIAAMAMSHDKMLTGWGMQILYNIRYRSTPEVVFAIAMVDAGEERLSACKFLYLISLRKEGQSPLLFEYLRLHHPDEYVKKFCTSLAEGREMKGE